MKIEGMIKSVQAAIAAGGADVTQTIKLEVHGPWKDLRDLMQKPLTITLEPGQMEFPGKHPLAEGAVDADVLPGTGKKRKAKSKELVPA